MIAVSSCIKIAENGSIAGLTFDHIAFFLRPLYLKVIASSFLLAISNTIICFLIAYPLAYFIAFNAKRFSNFFLILIIIPFWTNFLLHVYAWFFVLDKDGFLNMLLKGLGLVQNPATHLNTPFADDRDDGLLLSALHGLSIILLSRAHGCPSDRSIARSGSYLAADIPPHHTPFDKTGPKGGILPRLHSLLLASL